MPSIPRKYWWWIAETVTWHSLLCRLEIQKTKMKTVLNLFFEIQLILHCTNMCFTENIHIYKWTLKTKIANLILIKLEHLILNTGALSRVSHLLTLYCKRSVVVYKRQPIGHSPKQSPLIQRINMRSYTRALFEFGVMPE